MNKFDYRGWVHGGPGGGGGHTPQAKNVTLTENGTYAINADEGYDCLSSVTAEVNVSSGDTVAENDVTFYDFDGTPIASYTKSQALALTELPSGPDHSGDEIPLVFEGWNWTLAQIKEQLNDVGGLVNVGALHHTADGDTHVIYETNRPSMDVYLGLSSSSSYTIDWGDGTTSTEADSTTGEFTHNYSTSGKHHVKISGTFDYFKGSQASSSVQASSGNTLREFYPSQSIKTLDLNYTLVKKVSTSSSITKFDCNNSNLHIIIWSPLNNSYSPVEFVSNLTIVCLPFFDSAQTTSLDFNRSYNIRRITLPKNLVNTGSYFMSSCEERIVVPSNFIGGPYLFNNGHFIKGVEFNEGVTTIRPYAFQNSKITEIEIPSTVTQLYWSAFKQCYWLTKVVMKPTTPPTIDSDTFSGVSSVCRYIVPKGTLETYKAATNWSALAAQIIEEE